MWTFKDILKFRKIYGLHLLYASDNYVIIVITYLNVPHLQIALACKHSNTHTPAKWFSGCCTIAHSYPTIYDPWTAALQDSLSFTITWSLLKLMSIESVMPSHHLIICHPLLILFSIVPSIRVFSIKLTFCIRWPKYWSFSFSINLYNEYSGLVSYRIDGFDHLAVQWLSIVFSNTNSKTSILCCSAFFMVQLSHPYMTTGKAIALNIWIFVGFISPF